jgi:hypothetical protein
VKIHKVEHLQGPIVTACNAIIQNNSSHSLGLAKTFRVFAPLWMVDILSVLCNSCVKTSILPIVPDLQTTCSLNCTKTLSTQKFRIYWRLIITQNVSFILKYVVMTLVSIPPHNFASCPSWYYWGDKQGQSLIKTSETVVELCDNRIKIDFV